MSRPLPPPPSRASCSLAAAAGRLATILFRSRLVPRIIALIGLVGAPLLLVSALATMAGAINQVSILAAVLAMPIAVWEFSIAIWLVVRGFRTPTA